MDFGISKEQQMLKKEARNFLEKECPEELVREMERGNAGHSPDLWRKIADLGWLGLPFPETYGGLGGDLIDQMLIFEEMGRAMFPGPYLSTVTLCGSIILAAGTEEQKKEWLTKISDGALICALAVTEPDGAWGDRAWDAEGIELAAVKDGGDYVLNGTKLFVHDAVAADIIFCAARTKPSEKAEDGITIFAVDTGARGLTIEPLKTIANDKQCEVVFDGVRVPKSAVVGPVGGGWPFVYQAIQHGAVMLCAQMVGAGEELLRLSVDHAKSRVQFDAPVGINQYVQGHCTDLVSDVEGCRYVTCQAAWRLSRSMPAEYETAAAKAWTGEAFERACLAAHAVLAGYGYTSKDGVIPMYSRRGKTQQLYLGNTDYWLGKIADHLETWTFERPKGKPLGLWKTPPDEETPDWDVWTPEDILEV
ncbi:MAG: acyl-CoA dehydrogenase family protein [Desulfobacterales bacterium]